ncbi:hypothetical protein BsWGS_24489 [Bradybaena similaris]
MCRENYKLKSILVFLFVVSIHEAVVGNEGGEPSAKKRIKFGEVADEDILKKLKQKKLVTLVMSKPEECYELSENQDEVQVHYTGYLETGDIFDSSEGPGKKPITFVLGSRQVIPGWEEGLLNMCAGEKRRLIIPPNLAYGKAGFPPVIPPDATLLFEVTLLSLHKRGPASFGDIDTLLQLVKFLLIPAVALYIFYYLYHRYRAETQAAKEHKQFRGKGSRKRK